MTYFEPIELETAAAVLALRVTNILVTFGRRSTTRYSVVVSDGLVTHHWSEYVDEGELDVNDSFDNGGGNARFWYWLHWLAGPRVDWLELHAEVHGNDAVDDLIVRYHNQPLQLPQSGQQDPATPHIHWHTREVVKGPARVTGVEVATETAP